MVNNQREFIVTIDGPAGSGKSTAARNLAAKIGFDYLDTGGMYRCSALAGMKAGIDWNNPGELVSLVQKSEIVNCRGKTFLNGEDVSAEIRSAEVTRLTHYAADNPLVRDLMSELQRKSVLGRMIVTEGRDQGTAVFPDAAVKFYLTASPDVRARRRLKEMESRGEPVNFEEILASIVRRDEGDMQRTTGPLRRPEDAVEIDTDRMSAQEVVDAMANIVMERLEKK